MSPPLRIAVDLPWDASACMGTGAYSETMVRALATTQLEQILVGPAGAPRRIRLPRVRYSSLPSVDLLREGTRQLVLPAFLREISAAALFSPASLLPLVKVCPSVATVYDLTFSKHPEHYAPGLVEYLKRWFIPGLRIADRLIAISEDAKKDLVEIAGIDEARIRVIEAPVRETFRSPLGAREVSDRLRVLGVDRPFFFHVSNLSPHKNVKLALEAFGVYLKRSPRSPHLFILAGGGIAPNRPPDLQAIAESLGISSRVRYVGMVDDEDLKALYQGCAAFLFPSLAEGWGLPVAEARALGALVLASPHVPAMPQKERLELDVHAWASAMESDSPPRKPFPGPSLIEAGRALLEVLTEVAVDAPQSVQKGADPIVSIRGDWRSPSGYGHAARGLYQAMEGAGLRPSAVWAAKDAIQDPRLWSVPTALWRERTGIWVHPLPPDHMDLALAGKHVGAFFWETDRVPEGWKEILNGLDEIWVPARFLIDVIRQSGIETPTCFCPLPVDTETFSPGARRVPVADPPPGFDPTWTVFLYVGTWDPRKRPDVLVRAFSRAFRASDNALLIIKSYMTGNPAKDGRILESWISQSRSGDAHIRSLGGVLPPSSMVDLYRSATVFSTASRGEGYCLPAVQAMSCGKPVLAAAWSAFSDYVGIPVSHRLENVPEGVGLPGYSSDQRWAVVDEDDLAAKMRWVHTHRAEMMRLGEAARTWAVEHASMRVVGCRLASRVKDLLAAETVRKEQTAGERAVPLESTPVRGGAVP